MIREERQKEIELILNQLENKIKKYVKETTLDEREDLSQDLKIKLIEKLNILLDEKVPSFLDFTDSI
ncbi:hypothetical protein PZE06_19285 [Robertmurraya sp. DFI.2.37]|uniref:hypothetical protein n=1 Tax=Robertmurraya sp. DFI.2.37 TaxID=3031819 RepID=UPI0023DB7F48|nr:hypothetical protein [Robertmurraya sp. DFI.2.37]MDF1510280.1 hypothetical protein [Robertmurraya sp. DFI.2.37]